MMDRNVFDDKLCGCLLGLACGDALGMPAEGLSPYEVSLKYQKIDGFYGTTLRAAGSYTGVTQLAMLECLSLLDSNGNTDKKKSKDRILETKSRNKARWGFGLGPDPVFDDGKEKTEFISRGLPLALMFAANPCDDETLLKTCKRILDMERAVVLSSFAISWVAMELVRNSSAMESLDELSIADKSMMARLVDVCRQVESIIEKREKIEDKLSLRLQHVRTRIDQDMSLEEFVGFNGNSWRHSEAVPLAIFCFLKGPDDFDSVMNAATLGGASPFVAGMTGALSGCYSGTGSIPETIRDSVESYGSIMELSRRMSALANRGNP